MSILNDLKKAKSYSDARKYEDKHLLMRRLMSDAPDDFMVDSENADIIGITHIPTGFRMHLPKTVIAGLNLGAKQAGLAAGKGMPNIAGGGKGSYGLKKPSLKGMLTNATKEVGEKAKEKTPFERLFSATAEYQKKKTRQAGVLARAKNANFVANARKYMGYDPGFWYDDSTPHINRSRLGNVITGAGLTGLGLASIPILQYFFPERFEEKGTALTAAAILAGMGTPWLANFPHTAWELNNFASKDNDKYTLADRDYINLTQSSKTPAFVRFAGDPVTQKKSYVNIPLNTPIPRMQMADVAAEQLSSGYIDYGQAAGLMLAASRASQDRSWFTVGDLARAAIGAGAGAIAGTAAAKGIGMFMNLKPTEQKIIQGTGAALGTLINLGKLSL